MKKNIEMGEKCGNIEKGEMTNEWMCGREKRIEILLALLSVRLWQGLQTRKFNLYSSTDSLQKVLLLYSMPVKAWTRTVMGIYLGAVWILAQVSEQDLFTYNMQVKGETKVKQKVRKLFV